MSRFRLVLQFDSRSLTGLDELVALEETLMEVLKDSVVDGHDIGTGEANIFIETASPQSTFATIRQLLSHTQLGCMRVAYRQLDEEQYTTLWPDPYVGKFTVA